MPLLLGLLRVVLGYAAATLVASASLLVAADGVHALVHRDVLRDLAGLAPYVGVLGAPIGLVAAVIAEGTGERRLAFFVLLGAIAPSFYAVVVVGWSPLLSLVLVAAGAVGGAAYWAVAGRRSGAPAARPVV